MMADEDEKLEDFKPRSYQEQLMNQAKKQNTIIYLPTGSGKTFIAVMLIKEMSGALEGTFKAGGKRTFFLVNTVQLVKQQAAYIRRHVHYKVGEYSGDMNVDYWTGDIWDRELEQYEIIVMTCQILLNLLVHGYISLRDINLLIFDECHHAVEDHPMRCIMQQFQHCERDEQPRILGLTATLLNSNCKVNRVEEEVRNLETTFMGTVATCENMPIVNYYSAKPEEKVVPFKMDSNRPGEDVKKQGLEMLEAACKFVTGIEFEADSVISPGDQPPNTQLLNASQGKANKKLKNLLKDVEFHVNVLGLFGGSCACLAHTIQLERLRKKADDSLTKTVYTALITTLTAIRKLFEDAMSDCSIKSQIRKYSSYKMLTLIEVLSKGMPVTMPEAEAPAADEFKDLSYAELFTVLNKQNKKEKKQKPCCIIFVERRFTAKIIFHVLKALMKEDENFRHIIPDFIVGFNSNPFSDTREGYLEKKWNMDCVLKFRNGDTNVLVASEVLEEGIDVQNCNLVIKFDLPKNYRSYIQSKGRARHQNSLFYILVPENDQAAFHAKYVTYIATEKALLDLLVGRTQFRAEPCEDTIAADLYDEILPPYVTACSKVGLSAAISIVNRYCSVLPQDVFTQLTPYWFLETRGNKFCVHLQLPINSPLRDIIQGPEMPSRKLAKRAVALEMCRFLHLLGELNDNLLPLGRNSLAFDCLELFPLYVEDDSEDKNKIGSKKRKVHYVKQFPMTLSQCRPKGGVDVYLHVIEQTPVYERPDDSNHRKLTFYELLKRSEGFAILSAKPMPSICDFPIYMNVGELHVRVLVNAACMGLTEEKIRDVEMFNMMLFQQLLRLVKPFMMLDKSNLENSYYIVPTRKGADDCYEIDWEVVRRHGRLPEIQKPKLEETRALKVTNELYEHTVIAPWYRGMMADQSYIVTRLCSQLTPSSPFPSEEFDSYEDYYRRKYKLMIVNKDQPLLEVKAISNKINCLRPRSTKVTNATSKRKRQELQEDFEENLVPELCMRFEFPSVLWLKATCLPTILHRISHLLVAEELRETIVQDIGVGCIALPHGMEWEPLSVDLWCMEEEHASPHRTTALSTGVSKMRVTEKSNPMTISMHVDWGEDKEPVDIDRHMEEVTLVEVLNYDDFISKPLHAGASPRRGLNNVQRSIDLSLNPSDDFVLHKPINILNTSEEGVGPQLFEVTQALTSASANDIFNLERLETLGDSFLKLMASLYLFLRYQKVDEGKLTHVKGKLIGNRNLYYCGVNRKLGSLMKVHDFVPMSDWIPPSICVCRSLQQVIRECKFSPNVLYELIVPPEEQLSGFLSKESFDLIMAKLENAEDDTGIHSSMENFLSIQTVQDKTIADGVEALIGAYLRGSGVRGALKLLGWLQILPEKGSAPEYLLDKSPPSARLDNVTDHDINVYLEGVQELERRLQYTFRDRSYLLQALTHASYSTNRMTDCYQRLEFLGDAVLDFLITCHIYESCGKLNPGQLTDLRSALVNNVTFASLAVRFGFHKFLKYSSPKLMDVVDRFVKFQEERGHVINEEVLILLEENETRISEAVEVPKVLGDLFESIAGAIYLDCGLNLQEVWRVFYRLMHREISAFSKNVPKQPVRLLYELSITPPKFLPSKIIDECIILMIVEVFIDGRKQRYYGFGETKLQAKRAAAKHALKDMMK